MNASLFNLNSTATPACLSAEILVLGTLPTLAVPYYHTKWSVRKRCCLAGAQYRLAIG